MLVHVLMKQWNVIQDAHFDRSHIWMQPPNPGRVSPLGQLISCKAHRTLSMHYPQRTLTMGMLTPILSEPISKVKGNPNPPACLCMLLSLCSHCGSGIISHPQSPTSQTLWLTNPSVAKSKTQVWNAVLGAHLQEPRHDVHFGLSSKPIDGDISSGLPWDKPACMATCLPSKGGPARAFQWSPEPTRSYLLEHFICIRHNTMGSLGRTSWFPLAAVNKKSLRSRSKAIALLVITACYISAH